MDPEKSKQVREYSIVINDEGQYSIWPSDRPDVAGWQAIGSPRTKADCLAEIEREWTDMRPASLRAHLSGATKAQE